MLKEECVREREPCERGGVRGGAGEKLVRAFAALSSASVELSFQQEEKQSDRERAAMQCCDAEIVSLQKYVGKQCEDSVSICSRQGELSADRGVVSVMTHRSVAVYVF